MYWQVQGKSTKYCPNYQNWYKRIIQKYGSFPPEWRFKVLIFQLEQTPSLQLSDCSSLVFLHLALVLHQELHIATTQHCRYRAFLQVGFASQGNYTLCCAEKKRRLSHELGLIIFRTLPVPESSSNEAYLAHISCQVSTRPSGHGEMAGKGGGGEISSVEPSQLRWDPSGHQTHDILLSPRLSFCLHVPVSQSEETLVSL